MALQGAMAGITALEYGVSVRSRDNCKKIGLTKPSLRTANFWEREESLN